MTDPIAFERAIEVFVRGFCFTRSYTYPYLPQQVDGAWVMRDEPDRGPNSRVEEFVAHGIEPAELNALMRRHARGLFRICVMLREGECDRAIRAGFRNLRYRLMTTEAFFAHRLQAIPPDEAPFPILRVEKVEDAERLNRAAGRRQVLPQHLTADSPPVRQYVALDQDLPVGWAQSIVIGDATWCSSVFVQQPYRRRGIARSLLTRILSDDRDSGATASVLLASHAGAKLYPVVGYERIGTLLMFVPPRAARSS